MQKMAALALMGCIGCVAEVHGWHTMVGVEHGRRVYEITCDEDISECWSEARKVCHGAYDLRDRESTINGRRVSEYEGKMLIVCKRPQ